MYMKNVSIIVRLHRVIVAIYLKKDIDKLERKSTTKSY